MKMRVIETWTEYDGVRFGLEMVVCCNKAALGYDALGDVRSLEFTPRIGGYFEDATPVRMRIKSIEFSCDGLGNEQLEIWMTAEGPHSVRQRSARIKSEIMRRSEERFDSGKRRYCMEWPEVEVSEDIFTPATTARLDISMPARNAS